MLIRHVKQEAPAFVYGCDEAWDLEDADFLIATWKPYRELPIVRLSWEDYVKEWDSSTLESRLQGKAAFVVEFDVTELYDREPAQGAEEPEHLWRARRHNYYQHMQAAWKHLSEIAANMWVIPSEGPDCTADLLRHHEQQLVREHGIKVRLNKVIGKKKNARWQMLAALPGVDPYRKLPDGRLLGDILEPVVDWNGLETALNLRAWMHFDLSPSKGFGPGTIVDIVASIRKGEQKK